jgi:hypothetical protein
MDSNVPYLHITDKQYRLIGITWGFIFTAFYHYYTTFGETYSIVRTFLSGDFAVKAMIGMLLGYLVSYYILRWINS